jgi:phospholipase C
VVVKYDEWGGFFDHVRPTTAPDATPEAGTGMRGFRTPALTVSSRVRRGPGMRSHFGAEDDRVALGATTR